MKPEADGSATRFGAPMPRTDAAHAARANAPIYCKNDRGAPGVVVDSESTFVAMRWARLHGA
jgi:hypothetical protein